MCFEWLYTTERYKVRKNAKKDPERGFFGGSEYAFFIRKTCPCNEYPLKPHFYIAKLGYAGVYLFFLFLLQNIYCGYSLEPPRRGGSNEYPQSMF